MLHNKEKAVFRAVTSLVPRRQIERLVSNVYACATFFPTFQ